MNLLRVFISAIVKSFKQSLTVTLKEKPPVNVDFQIKKTLVLTALLFAGLVFNTTVHAELVQAPWNMLQFDDQDGVVGNNDIYDSTIEGGVLNDSSLSDVSGMGVEAQRIEAEQKLSVILWDERGNNNRRQAISSAEGQGNLQSVSVTVTSK